MKLYGLVLAALTVLILGAKVLQAGWNGGSNAKPEGAQIKAVESESERDVILRWQQNRPVHWRGYVLQQH